MLTKLQKKLIISRCKNSFEYFVEKFCKIKHANAGTIPFKLFKYQKKSIRLFNKKDRIIYRKCRQSGISTLTGAYALWVALFFKGTNVLIVSKRDEDAIAYLDRNVKFVYENLPEWMHQIFGDPRSGQSRKFGPPKAYNEHTMEFFHGSRIRSLTSSKDTLRSNTASLVIIDEAAFIHEMEAMWTAGQPTLMHGGRVIVISTCNGKGNWYHNTWEDAIAKTNGFTPIEIPWWDMDWVIEFVDKVTKKKRRIAPCDNIEKCTDKDDIRKYGPFKSPWLIQQYNELQQKGESWKFKQEILMEFIGIGNTVLSQEAIKKIEIDIDNNFKVMKKPVVYNNENAGIRNMILDFQGQLRIWHLPVNRIADVVKNGRVIKKGIEGHRYSMGVDISTGESSDYSGVQIVDVNFRKQVAELKIKCEPRELEMMVDYLGRLYNNALAVVESTGIGKTVCQNLKSLYYYPNLFYRMTSSGKRDKKPGFSTSGSSKPEIVKSISDNFGSEDGVLFVSSRLHKECNVFVHLGGGRVGNEPGTDNNDDLMISGGLACIGLIDAMQTPDGLIPTSSRHVEEHFGEKLDVSMDDMITKGGRNMLYPIMVEDSNDFNDVQLSSEREMAKFMSQIGGITTESSLRSISSKKDYFGSR